MERIIVISSKGHFPLGGIFRAERHFLLFKDQLAESGHQKTKETIVSRGKFRLAGNDPKDHYVYHRLIISLPGIESNVTIFAKVLLSFSWIC